LEGICKSSDFAFEWGRSLVKTYVELDRFGDAQKTLDRVLNRFPENPEAWQIAVWVGLQEGNFIKAAAAMAVAGKLSTPDAKTLGRLGELYQMAGVPVKAAEAFERSWAGTPSGADWDRVVNTLLSGHRYEMALAPARSAAAAEPTAKRWETLGDIAFRLRRFEESLAAYRRAGRLSSQANCFLKAGLAALKLEDFPTAAEFLEKAMAQSPKTSRVFQTARRHLAFIHKMTDFLQRQAETRSTP
jgi:tetratricopeptide (TPR) repeat protein